MTDKRHKNGNWSVGEADGRIPTWERVGIAVLMDIRDELQQINRFLGCYRIPKALDAAIELGAEARRRKRNAAKRRKAAKR